MLDFRDHSHAEYANRLVVIFSPAREKEDFVAKGDFMR